MQRKIQSCVQKAMQSFFSAEESRNPGNAAAGINRERSADCAVPFGWYQKAPDTGSRREKIFVGKIREIRIVITTSLSEKCMGTDGAVLAQQGFAVFDSKDIVGRRKDRIQSAPEK